MDFIQEFLLYMQDLGFEPKGGNIIADDKWHQARAPGDKGNWFTATYSMKIVDANFAIGCCFSRKDPDTKYKWHSKTGEKLTPEERNRINKELKAQQKAKELAEARYQERIANRLTKYCNALPKATEHDYLTNKGILPHGAKYRKKTGELILPCKSTDGKVWTIQKINKIGGKYLFAGGRKQGSYVAFAKKGDDFSIVAVAEGFSTAASVREATGLITIAAIDSGNLKPVLIDLKKKYPETRFIICADDDAFTKNAKGELWNVGKIKANEAAEAIGGAYICSPKFRDTEDYKRNKYTDYNDLHAAEGSSVVKDQIEEIINKIPAKQEVTGELETNRVPDQQLSGDTQIKEAQWKKEVRCDKTGYPEKNSLKNKILFLANHHAYKDVFRYDEFSHKIMITRCPPWCDQKSFRVHEMNDVDITEATASIENIGLSPDRVKVHNAIEVVAYKNKFHPAQDYFNSLKWDGVNRLDTWLTDYLNADNDDDPKYLAFIGKKWLTAAVKRVFEQGCKFDHVLVMEGEQGRGKSTALKVLSTFGDDIEESYFTDSITISDIQNKDTIQKIQGSIIVELAELAGFNKKDDEEIKRWITLQHDDCRLPYARTTTRFKRQFILSATTNSYDYLKDPTGNRRYWPMRSGVINLEALRENRKHLWAEAVHHYKQGLYIGPTPEETNLAKAAQNKRRTIDIWEDDVLSTIRKLSGFTKDLLPIKTDKIMKEMGMVLRERDTRSAKRVVAILQSNGYENCVRKKSGKSIRGWVIKRDEIIEPQLPIDDQEIPFDEKTYQ